MTRPLTLSQRLEGTAENLAATLDDDGEYDITIDREEVQEHVDFLHEAAVAVAKLEAGPVPAPPPGWSIRQPDIGKHAAAHSGPGGHYMHKWRDTHEEAVKDAVELDASGTFEPSIEQRMAVAGYKLNGLLAEAHVVPTSGATFGAGLLSDCAMLLVQGHAQIVVARQQVREQGLALAERDADLLAIRGAYFEGAGTIGTLAEIVGAVRHGADAALEGPFAASMRVLEKAYLEASGGKRATLEDLVAAIHRGAR